MRNLNLIAGALIVAAGLSFGALASADPVSQAESKTGTVQASALRMRSGPGTRFRSSRVLQRGTEVKVVGKRGNWLKIKAQGRIGYVYKTFIKLEPVTESETEAETETVSVPGIVGVLGGISGDSASHEGAPASSASANSSGSASSSSPASPGTAPVSSTPSRSSTPAPSRRPTVNLPLGETDEDAAPAGATGGAENWLRIAQAESGVREARGSRNNPRILAFHAATSLGARKDSVAWCSSFVNWVMKKAGHGGTNSAAARSWLSYGKRLTKPVKGAIVIFRRGSSNWQGHVAFYLGEAGSGRITVIGGNQSDAVNTKSYPKSKVLGYRWPAGVPLPIN